MDDLSKSLAELGEMIDRQNARIATLEDTITDIKHYVKHRSDTTAKVIGDMLDQHATPTVANLDERPMSSGTQVQPKPSPGPRLVASLTELKDRLAEPKPAASEDVSSAPTSGAGWSGTRATLTQLYESFDAWMLDADLDEDAAGLCSEVRDVLRSSSDVEKMARERSSAPTSRPGRGDCGWPPIGDCDWPPLKDVFIPMPRGNAKHRPKAEPMDEHGMTMRDRMIASGVAPHQVPAHLQMPGDDAVKLTPAAPMSVKVGCVALSADVRDAVQPKPQPVSNADELPPAPAEPSGDRALRLVKKLGECVRTRWIEAASMGVLSTDWRSELDAIIAECDRQGGGG